ncbi:DinB family protein [Streptomyces luteolus]|uniref:DinB family protein n=1 Tax=Streptomyces luteolus TaxID=3043615 RepID=A0ABT6SSH6_9ACTN|nr:DinB family protein [Streptomyces sp. B-S-A12]MDI3418340.1 DinB family protein [Streptomyces sp. B-S-A12]
MTQRNDTRPLRTEADERASLSRFLDDQRAILERKCAGLTAGQLRTRAVEPSALTLLGLVRHAAEVERSWFRNVLAGQSTTTRWPGARPGEFAEFDVAEADPGEAFAAWREECAYAREFTASATSLDVTGTAHGEEYTLRYVLTHMIEEYARHNGHADLLRERIDGATGE